MKNNDELARPTLIDERDGVCNICTLRRPGVCDDCGIGIPTYENMSGNGYQSPKPSHFHLEMVAGVQGRRAKYQELCKICYDALYERTYPGARKSAVGIS
jgi:hypothetical protein